MTFNKHASNLLWIFCSSLYKEMFSFFLGIKFYSKQTKQKQSEFAFFIGKISLTIMLQQEYSYPFYR